MVKQFDRKVSMTTKVRFVPREMDDIPLPWNMTTKQLVAQVRQGKRCTFSMFDDDPISGYLSGWDLDNWFVLQILYNPLDNGKWFVKRLVPRNKEPVLLHDEQTFKDEIDFIEMERIVKPFRDAVTNLYFVEE